MIPPQNLASRKPLVLPEVVPSLPALPVLRSRRERLVELLRWLCGWILALGGGAPELLQRASARLRRPPAPAPAPQEPSGSSCVAIFEGMPTLQFQRVTRPSAQRAPVASELDTLRDLPACDARSARG
jgi:hypothetical protein